MEEEKLLPGKFCDFVGKNKEMHKENLPFWKAILISCINNIAIIFGSYMYLYHCMCYIQTTVHVGVGLVLCRRANTVVNLKQVRVYWSRIHMRMAI